MLFGFLFWKNFAQKIEITKTFDKPSNNAFVTDFTPGDRVESGSVLIKDPVYMHLKIPKRAGFLKIEFGGENVYNDLKLGIQTGETKDEFKLYTAEENESGQAYYIDMSLGFYDAEGRYTLIYSFDDSKPLEVGDIKIKDYDGLFK